MSDNGFTVSTPEGIAMVSLLTMRSALKLEVNTGLKATRVNVANAVRHTLKSKTRSKAKLLEELNAYIESLQKSGLDKTTPRPQPIN